MMNEKSSFVLPTDTLFMCVMNSPSNIMFMFERNANIQPLSEIEIKHKIIFDFN